MARLNTAQLVHHATSVSSRANQVQQDPAVQKAWRDAGTDVSKAATSVATAFFETRTAWRRTRPASTVDAHSYA